MLAPPTQVSRVPNSWRNTALKGVGLECCPNWALRSSKKLPSPIPPPDMDITLPTPSTLPLSVILTSRKILVAAVAEWYRYRTVACLVTSSSPVPLKTRRVGQRCTLNLSRAETSSRWCGVVVRRGDASSGVVHVT
ncbi:uncharacterized protein TNCV_1125321 [Trichonephila clavipes]|nr:uncharacterized protein TNCV_1125321 [Trichonephila clavipes]